MSGTVVLTGGVGGAKLVLGLVHAIGSENITVIVNTGDDFQHYGLHISPDIDTLLYTLSGKANANQGWGRDGESWAFLSALQELGGEDWFQLGDMDLALHILRTQMLAKGETLTAITAHVARKWKIKAKILPMSDNPIATMIDTDIGVLEFQRFFVERRCEPVVRSVHFAGAAEAKPAPGVIESIHAADTVLIAPSNPYLSIDPILALPDIRQALMDCAARIIAVSPLIGGNAVKGPTAKLMKELGIETDNASIARHYGNILDGLVINTGDSCNADIQTMQTDTMMRSLDDKIRVARAAMNLAEVLA